METSVLAYAANLVAGKTLSKSNLVQYDNSLGPAE